MKSAIVTGSSAGIGEETARLLSERGLFVVLNGTNQEKLSRVVDSIGGRNRAVGVVGDVSQTETAERLLEAATADGHVLETVVNNAGAIANKSIVDLNDDEFDHVVNVNLRGTFMVCRAAARYWKNRAETSGDAERFNLVNMTSRAALLSNPMQSQYAASKAGIIALTQVLARELRPYGVRSNTIAPRAYTDMMKVAGEFQEDALEEWSPKYPARFVNFLRSEAASGITGQIFVVHGWHLQLARTWDVSGSIDIDYSAPPESLLEQVEPLFNGEPTEINDNYVDDLPLKDSTADPFRVN